VGLATVTINGRTYRLRCRDGEEPRLLAVADRVRMRVDALTEEFGGDGDDRLLLMAALLLADELIELESRLALTATPQNTAIAEPPAHAPWPRGTR
jgi:cell division protein ZapA